MSIPLNYLPCDSAHLYHTIKGSESEYGVQAILVRQYQPLPDAFAVDAAKVQRLLEGKSQLPKALVFMQVCEPGSNFGSYESTPHRCVMTSANYLKLLHFFANDWDRTYMRIQDEINKMRESRQWVKISPNLFFMGHGIVEFGYPLDDKLKAIVRCCSDSNLLTAYLEYSDELLGTCPLYMRCLSIMANNKMVLEKILATATVHPAASAVKNVPMMPSLPRLHSPMSSAGSTLGEAPPSHRSGGYKEPLTRTIQF